ncbi:hypothetical protein BG74_00700 [Sodalis-like endosymbiont of Proechinophthirus fluctus]|uniref:hypothetical protein n=1 Tax=Sodalis-like endosymbiont of Proechinophthirus fluctus TaxID=1462730 RepID=UPI0007A84583|nr:hypothetical protein [Sodalis-like endosymbiont of Proechinophthirus fluctus]KYP97742.1 hypothetical protein BG74_00700 [Sodalis-like endosymbiont of Proechinophthirus fluctus]
MDGREKAAGQCNDEEEEKMVEGWQQERNRERERQKKSYTKRERERKFVGITESILRDVPNRKGKIKKN